MPNNNTGLVLAVALGIGGVGTLIYALSQGNKTHPPIGQLKPGESASDPSAPMFNAAGTITVPLSGLQPVGSPQPAVIFTVQQPIWKYSGPGRKTFAYVGVYQNQGTPTWPTVAASGVAGYRSGPAGSQAPFALVDPNQVEPSGCPPQSLCVYVWPGPNPGGNGIAMCGAPPRPGPANVVLHVYEDAASSGNPADADGYSSPSCNPTRSALKIYQWVNKVNFVP